MAYSLLRIENPLECRIIQRINRFVVEISINGAEYRACINNTGRLEEFLVQDKVGFCLRNERPGKTDYRLFAISEGKMAAIIDTRLQMRAFEKAVAVGLVPWLKEYRILRRDAHLGTSLFDYLLEHNGEKVYLEVKSAALREGIYAMYPDCPTVRGRRHIKELTEYAIAGGRAFIVFMAALPDVSAFKPNIKSDPELYELLVKAKLEGVQIKAIEIAFNPADAFVSFINPDLEIELS